jgi:hypothetical protein
METGEYTLISTHSPSPLTGEGWGEGVISLFFPLPSIPSRQERGVSGLVFFNIYFRGRNYFLTILVIPYIVLSICPGRKRGLF